MMKKRLSKVLFGFLVLGILGFSREVSAQEQLGSTHTQDVIIVKYGLPSGSQHFSESQTVNTGEKINNIPTSNQDSELVAMAGIHYVIQKIEPTGDGNAIHLANSSTYSFVSQQVEVVTGADGLVSVHLQDGYYIVSEQANLEAHLSTPATPILLRLPVENETKNGYLSEVYIYPKSSVDPQETTPEVKKTKRILPKTGEGMTLNWSIFGGLLVGIAMGFWGKRKRGGVDEKK